MWKMVALSSTEVEYQTLTHTTIEIAWIKTLFFELSLLITKPLVIWCDNQSANALTSNPVFHARTKHIEIDIHYIKD